MPLSAYLAFALPRLELPGPEPDEALTALPALPLLGYVTTEGMPGKYARLGSLTLPVRFNDYHMALESYLVAPFIHVLGPTAQALRVCTIFVGVLTLLVLARLTYAITGRLDLSWFAATLLAIYPAYVTCTRQGMYTASILMFFHTASLLAFLRWLQTARGRWCFLGFCLLCCGMASRLWFIYCLLTQMTLGILFAPTIWRQLAEDNAPAVRRKIATALCLVQLGSALLILQLIYSRSSNLGAHIKTTDNLQYSENLKFRYHQLLDVFKRDCCLTQRFKDRYESRSYRLHWLLLTLALLSMVASSLLGWNKSCRKERLFFILYLPIFLLWSPFSLSYLNTVHLLPILPVVILIIALAFRDMLLRCPTRSRPWILCSVIIACLTFDPPRIQSLLETMRTVRSENTDTIYPLAAWLQENPGLHPVALEWGLHDNVTYLTGGRVIPQTPFDVPSNQLSKPSFFEAFFSNPDNVYLSYTMDARERPPFKKIFFLRAAEFNKKLLEVRFSTQKDTPAISAYMLENAGRPVFK